MSEHAPPALLGNRAKTVSHGGINHRPAAWSIVEQEPLPANIHGLLDCVSAGQPQCVVWRSIDGDHTVMTYGELRRRSIVCAQHLQLMGVRKGTHIALMMPNVVGFLISWIALCRLGAVAVMVNIASTSSELGRLIRESDASYLIIDRQFLHTYHGVPADFRLREKQVIVHGDDEAAVSPLEDAIDWSDLIAGEGDPDARMLEVGLDDIAGILFTSGSSGVPKGCMLSHRYWLTLGKSRSAVGPAPGSMLIDTPMFYMGSLWKIMMGLYCGATLNVALRYSLSKLVDRITDNKIEFCTATSPAAKLAYDPRLEHSSLKFVTTYGLTKELHLEMQRRFGVPVREIYGMTEVGSALSMPVEDDSMTGSGSCGQPAPFRVCKIMADGQEVLDGTPGELWIGGPGLFSGYYRNQEATNSVFDGAWFRTGDLFRRDESGYYYMLGRIKDIIRRSSENISAAEVELAVTAIDGVFEAAAIPVPDPLRGEEVKVVIARTLNQIGAQLTPEQVIRECQQTLSPFKVPRYLEFMDALPKTASAKIDKPRLKAEAAGVTGHVYDTTIHQGKLTP